MSTRKEIINDILKSELTPEDIQSINKALGLKMKRNARQFTDDLEIGDKVITTVGLKPKYMQGRTGFVTEINLNTVEVDFKVPMRRYGAKISVPASCLRRVG